MKNNLEKFRTIKKTLFVINIMATVVFIIIMAVVLFK
jgi:hypothetical protein